MKVKRLTGGDLHHLSVLSEAQLPRIADVFYDANREAAGIAAGNALSDISAPGWVELCDELQRMYAQVGETVLTAAEGIRRAAQAYVDADLASKQELEAYLADPANRDTVNDPTTIAPTPGGEDDPGQPILPGQ